jgi:hypothetical protein
MARWERTTPWRQGSLLSAESVAALRLNDGCAPDEVVVVVISHDCDLAQPVESEPVVEVIVGRFVAGRIDGNFSHCKNPRRLHVACTGGRHSCVLSLDAGSKRRLAKEPANDEPGLADHVPCELHRLAARERRLMQRWLAARYLRTAFPDEFDRRLGKCTGVAERLGKAFKDTGKFVVAVFFDVDAGEELVCEGEDDPYEVHVTLLYSTTEDPAAAEAAANSAAARVREVFEQGCLIEGVWRWIELLGVDVMSDQALTYANSLELTKWNADHVSLKAEPEQPVLS